MNRPVPEYLKKLAARLAELEDALHAKVDFGRRLTADDLATIYAATLVGVVADELVVFAGTGKTDRLRELADHVSGWVLDAVAYAPAN